VIHAFVTEGTSRPTAMRLVNESLALAGEFWECGVCRGNTAKMIKDRIGDDRVLRLFDTFSSCPLPSPEDLGGPEARWWSFDTTLDLVKSRVSGPNVFYHVGVVPETFAGLEDAKVAFAYVDLTLYLGTKGALSFVVPRLVPGGTVFIRDYYGSTKKWPGLVKAVDELGLDLERHDYDAVVRAR